MKKLEIESVLVKNRQEVVIDDKLFNKIGLGVFSSKEREEKFINGDEFENPCFLIHDNDEWRI